MISNTSSKRRSAHYLATAALALAHPPGLLMGLAMTVMFAAALAVGERRARPFLIALAGLALGLALAAFSWLPFWVKVRGTVSFIESRGVVYCLIGYTRNGRWSANEQDIWGTLKSFEPAADSEVQQAQPRRIAMVSLNEPTSLASLAITRVSPVEPAVLALMNQVPVDSILPAAQRVKWVLGSATH